MGNATIQGQLWGARAQDWATYTEQVCLPLFGAALEAIQYGIRINCLCPGPVDTPMSLRPGEDRAARDVRTASCCSEQKSCCSKTGKH
jgi:hypothetical protein